MSSVEELSALITQQGDTVRNLKSAKQDTTAALKALLDLKERYQTTNYYPRDVHMFTMILRCLAFLRRYKIANGGVEFGPPKQEKPKQEKKDPQSAPVKEKEGPSKKELNKLARKEKAAAFKTGGGEAVEASPPAVQDTSSSKESSAADVKKAPAKVPSIQEAAKVPCKDGVYFSVKYPFPEVARLTSLLVGSDLAFFASTDSSSHLPYYYNEASKSSSISGDSNIARYLSRSSSRGSALYGEKDAWLSSEVDTWLDVFTSHLTLADEILEQNLPPLLNTHFEGKTYIVGGTLSLADIALFVSMKRIKFVPSTSFPHASRWYSLMDGTLPKADQQVHGVPKAGNGKVGGKGKSSSVDVPTSSVGAAVGETATDDGGACPPLEDAVEGAVCTRFPPEPSGYLHIGQCIIIFSRPFL